MSLCPTHADEAAQRAIHRIAEILADLPEEFSSVVSIQTNYGTLHNAFAAPVDDRPENVQVFSHLRDLVANARDEFGEITTPEPAYRVSASGEAVPESVVKVAHEARATLAAMLGVDPSEIEIVDIVPVGEYTQG